MSTPWPENPKFCKDCKWFASPGYVLSHELLWNTCLNPSVGKLSLVVGKRYDECCDEARKPSGVCGIEARYFEPKEQKP